MHKQNLLSTAEVAEAYAAHGIRLSPASLDFDVRCLNHVAASYGKAAARRSLAGYVQEELRQRACDSAEAAHEARAPRR